MGSEPPVEGLDWSGLTGVGLYRTEFEFMSRSTMPSEDELAALYAEALRKVNGKPARQTHQVRRQSITAWSSVT